MFPVRPSVAAYAQVGTQTSVLSANPHKLVVLLFDGALTALHTARGHMERMETPEKCALINKAIDIIDEGLHAPLDVEQGGDLAHSLALLYTYMTARLAKANLYNDPLALDEVAALLKELRDAWASIETPGA